MKRYTAEYEIWYLWDDKKHVEYTQKMWGVKDNESDEWETEPEHLDGSYKKARSRAKEINDKLDLEKLLQKNKHIIKIDLIEAEKALTKEEFTLLQNLIHKSKDI